MTTLGTFCVLAFFALLAVVSVLKSIAGTAMKYPGLTLRGGMAANKFFRK